MAPRSTAVWGWRECAAAGQIEGSIGGEIERFICKRFPGSPVVDQTNGLPIGSRIGNPGSMDHPEREGVERHHPVGGTTKMYITAKTWSCLGGLHKSPQFKL